MKLLTIKNLTTSTTITTQQKLSVKILSIIYCDKKKSAF